MSLDTRGIDPQRLLPQSLEDRLLSWLSRVCGGLLLLCTLGVWASLASWSLGDPSLTHATTNETQNWLGPIGAIVSDLLLQTLGFAAALALVVVLIWSVDLIVSESAVAGGAKLGAFPLAVLAIAGALSALPVAAGWPLHHGYGGVVGDGVFRLTNNLFALLSGNRSGLAAGILLSGLSVVLGARTIGADLEKVASQLLAMWNDRRLRRQAASDSAIDDEPAHDRFAAVGQRSTEFGATVGAVAAEGGGRAPQGDRDHNGRWHPAPDLAFPAAGWRGGERDLGDVRPLDPQSENFEPRFGTDLGAPDFHLDETLSRRPAVAPAFGDRDGSFDLFTDAASRAIAARFAPASVDTVTPPALADQAGSAAKLARNAAGLLGGTASNRSPAAWKRPSLNLLKRPATAKPGPEFTQTVMRGNARLLEDVLSDFGVKGEVKDIKPGPVVTLYELEPARGTKSSRVIGLADDMARSMSVASVRAAVVPGRNAIGL